MDYIFRRGNLKQENGHYLCHHIVIGIHELVTCQPYGCFGRRVTITVEREDGTQIEKYVSLNVTGR